MYYLSHSINKAFKNLFYKYIWIMIIIIFKIFKHQN